MRLSRRIVIPFVLAAFLLAAMALALKPSPANERLLPDGTIVRLGKISYGKTHRYVTGNFAQQFAGRFLPDKMATTIGAKVHRATNATDKLFFFFEYHNQANTRNPARWCQPNPLIVSDDSGNQFVQNSPIYFSASGSNSVEGFNIPMEAHLSKNLKLRICPYDYVRQSNYTADFSARNPEAQAVSKWTAHPLPQTNQFGDLQAIFLGAEKATIPEYGNKEYTDRRWTCARVQFLQNGLPAKEVRANGFMIIDQAGQTLQPASYVGYPPDTNGISRLFFTGAFSSAENWKFRFHLFDLPPTQLPPIGTVEQWQLERLALPELPEKYAGEISSTVQGCKVIVTQFTRKGLHLAITPQPNELSAMLVLKTGDRTGKKITVNEGRNGDYQFKIPADVKSVGLEFSLTKNQVAEFIAQPLGK